MLIFHFLTTVDSLPWIPFSGKLRAHCYGNRSMAFYPHFKNEEVQDLSRKLATVTSADLKDEAFRYFP